jgi:hypothetical protein
MKCRFREDLFAGEGCVPDAACAVIGDEHAAVLGNRDTYGPAPDLSVFRDKAGEKVLVASVGVAVVHGNADDLLSGTVLSVP